MWLLLLLFYGVAFGTLTAIVAKGKNRDQFIWFWIGFFFGIFGFIAALVVEKKENAAHQPQATASSRRQNHFEPSEIEKQCPDCAEKIKLEARVCRFCGYRFSDQAVRSAVVEAHWNWLHTASQPKTVMYTAISVVKRHGRILASRHTSFAQNARMSKKRSQQKLEATPFLATTVLHHLNSSGVAFVLTCFFPPLAAPGPVSAACAEHRQFQQKQG